MEKPPHNPLTWAKSKCNSCGESRVDYIDVTTVIDSVDCTIYKLFCNVCAHDTFVEMVNPKVPVEPELNINMRDSSYRITPVRSMLTGKILDAKSKGAGEKNGD